MPRPHNKTIFNLADEFRKNIGRGLDEIKRRNSNLRVSVFEMMLEIGQIRARLEPEIILAFRDHENRGHDPDGGGTQTAANTQRPRFRIEHILKLALCGGNDIADQWPAVEEGSDKIRRFDTRFLPPEQFDGQRALDGG